MAKTLRQIQSEKRRLAILQTLEQCNAYSASPELLQEVLVGTGDGCGMSVISEEIMFLRLSGLLMTELDVETGMELVKLLQRGNDVVRGLESVDGVRRPSPARY